jgi:hypothetical protein
VQVLGTLIAGAAIGGALVGVDRLRKQSAARIKARVTAAPAPTPLPPPPEPGPGPTPMPEPTPDEGEELVEIDADWQEECWWGMKTPADAYLDAGVVYVKDWPADWAGEEELRVWCEPPDLATVEPTAFWQGDEIVVEVIVRPKRRGWGTLMATEGTPGVEATKGEVPWRAQCMKIEVV